MSQAGSLDAALGDARPRRWFSLQELLDAVLYEVVEADVRAQVLQREVWHDVSQSLGELDRFQQVAGLSLVAGLDRFENLGLTQMTVELAVQRESWIRRLWRRLRKLTGRRVEPEAARYRLARRAGRRPGHVHLRVRVSRRGSGGWEVDSLEGAPSGSDAPPTRPGTETPDMQ